MPVSTKDEPTANVDVRVRRGIVAIPVEPDVGTVVPIATAVDGQYP